MNLFKKIKTGLSKTRNSLVENIRRAVGGSRLDEDILEELEEILITADLGVDTSLTLIEKMRERAKSEIIEGNRVLEVMAEELHKMVAEVSDAKNEPESSGKPRVTFVVGVNGSGKTTTIGKLSQHYARDGEKVLIVAADTFRSAAMEQLAIWAERSGVDIVLGKTGSDPGAIVYDGLQAAIKRDMDRVFVDTAGRLHTNKNLMRELEKLDRVAKKIIPDAPHEVLLVIDGTTGQNGLSQAKKFAEVCGVTGLAVTKLDGTAKGGVIVPIGRELNIPVRYIGLGEGIDDLVPFNPDFVVDAIISTNSTHVDNSNLKMTSEDQTTHENPVMESDIEEEIESSESSKEKNDSETAVKTLNDSGSSLDKEEVEASDNDEPGDFEEQPEKKPNTFSRWILGE